MDWRGHHTLERGLPWLVPEAIVAIDAFLRADMRVLEVGAGGSTIFFAERVAAVESYETSPAWAAQVQAELDARRLANVTITVLQVGWRGRCNAIAIAPTGMCDVAVVDCDWRKLNRGHAIARVSPFVRPGGILVLDNYAVWGGEYAPELLAGWGVETYNAPADIGVRSGYRGRGTQIYRRPQ